ncbi:uncharacterized protein A1O9_09023 [Exophiala aquamarina CBS 119918]|uniref:Major facilitator superfamily (MFS) profile domain-containing protein n=1 Tax=Exophiala aquamarina CBS 119918 TaxID=1182545 RepID=A0A072P3Z3_9EURO|nr:uncharacterized protein A1O9_09023 [Exophiala aquamarina CBS 119918]KEF54581.1 hypothetical protein A1O9_09023 [Exophiala aquamarina CBS 119918]
MAQLMAIVGSGFLAQSIASLFNGSSQVVWLGSIVNIICTALALPFSQAADLLGRRWFIAIPTAFGCAGGIIVSRAESMATIIGGFCVLGVSYGAQPLLLAVASEVLPRRHRPIVQATANVCAGVGAIIGLCMGGALIKDGNLENFRIYFYVNAGAFALASAICLALYNPPPRENGLGLTVQEKARRLDWVGYVAMPIGLVLFSIGLYWAENPHPWGSAQVLAPLVVGAVILACWGVYETRWQKEGMLHRVLFQRRNFGLALAAIGAEGFVFFICNNYLPYEVSVFKPGDILVVGSHFTLVFAVSIPAALVISALASWKKIVRLPMVLGFFLFMLFCILMATSSRYTSASAFWGFPVILGMGFGACLPSLFSAAQLGTPPELIGLATGLMVASRGVGGVLALAINNAIFNARLSTLGSKIADATLPLGLPPASLPSLITALMTHDDALLENVEGVTQQIIVAGGSAVLGVYERGFRDVWICASCVAFAALAAVSFTNDPSGEFTRHIDATVEILPAEHISGKEQSVDTEVSNLDKGLERAQHRDHVE